MTTTPTTTASDAGAIQRGLAAWYGPKDPGPHNEPWQIEYMRAVIAATAPQSATERDKARFQKLRTQWNRLGIGASNRILDDFGLAGEAHWTFDRIVDHSAIDDDGEAPSIQPATNGELPELLADLLEYMNERYDADSDGNSFVPTEEMRLGLRIQAALASKADGGES